MMAAARRKLIDIGANLTGRKNCLVQVRIINDCLFPDSMFMGIYHGKQHHQPDLSNVLERAKKIGLEKVGMFVLLSSLSNLLFPRL